MANPTSTGMNRTGMDTSPMHAKRLMEISNEHPVRPGEATEFARVRRERSQESATVGSVPPPGTAKGMATTAVEMIKGHKPTVLIDKLGERLAFERTSVRLYEAILVKFDALGTWEGGPTREALVQIRDDELAHFELLKQCVQKVGADPTAMTPSADVVGIESAGVLKVITDPRSTLAQALHAILIAERADSEGWLLLTQLAQELGHTDLAQRFAAAEKTEDQHGEWVRNWLAASVMQDAQRELSGGKKGG